MQPYPDPFPQFLPLVDAINEDDVQLLKAAVESDPNFENNQYIDIDGRTLLFVAARDGRKKCVRYLLEINTDPNVRNLSGTAPIFVASQNGHREVVLDLINFGSEINVTCSDGSSPIYTSSQFGHPEVVRLLANNGADFNLQCTDDLTSPLYTAIHNLNYDIAYFLISLGAKLDHHTTGNWTPLMQGCYEGDLPSVRLLLKFGANPNVTPWTTSPLLELVRHAPNNQLELAKLLLEHGADCDLPLQNSARKLALKTGSKMIELFPEEHPT